MTARKENPQTAGRPTDYDPSYCDSVVKLCRLGATDAELADFYGVAKSTIALWKKIYPEFSDAIKAGKEKADSEVADSLYHRALGYEHAEDQIFQYEGKPLIVPTIKHYPPDSTAMIFWLKNRRPDLWREKHEIDQHIDANVKSKIVVEFVESDSKNVKE
jgi:hypothetical protein